MKEKQDFLSKVSYVFSPYYDFSKPISESSVIDTIQIFKSKLTDFQQQKSDLKQQLNQIRSVFGVQKHADLVSFAEDTIRQINDSNQQVNDLQNKLNSLENSPAMKNNQSAREWEEWARSIYLNIAENSSVVATNSNVRKGIEDAIGIGPRNSLDKRKIENLIHQKNILLNQKGLSELFGKNPIKKGLFAKNGSIRHLILVLTSINRIQKLVKKNNPDNKKNIKQQQKIDQYHDDVTSKNFSPSQKFLNSEKQSQKPKQSFFSININDDYELSDNCSPVPIFNNFADE